MFNNIKEHLQLLHYKKLWENSQEQISDLKDNLKRLEQNVSSLVGKVTELTQVNNDLMDQLKFGL